ncbi:RluA family pseudouridine synthase [Turicibacter sanguinis]|uniref:Pseudouridine synthase n=2 Tax=Turicibacter sanguinis TaxID=154288 RepID=A0A9X5APZ9_9FIRM|nr:RluA family pseudouridine synthase [Turicibacter sanguinis]EFF64694.1 pseudouridine synthase, RluA family [Turicibacter sanguinis PC909]MCU7192694.1 RluA family pseudouridine synthase [Turicibacter sanguinis]MTK22797.1 RluA family pseudouridine synthase [Turicibacter sanguinis]MTK73926.1 RluA family pseudouridine synthase [Turicibacter sanguinis]MTP79900.1 RluA family pseudouridine synthase [Turicibacter sanguinis]
MSLTLTYEIKAADDQTLLLNFLKKQDISKKAIVATKHRGGNMEVNGEHQNVRYLLKEGDVLVITFPEEERSTGLTPYEMPLDVVYEDEYLLVINKPAGIPTIPSLRHPEKTLANALIHYYNEHEIASTIHFVNRLDRDTSGLLMVAKYRHIHHLLTKDVKQIKRKYYTLVKGVMEKNSGTVHAPIARESEGNVRRCVRADGDDSITHYQVLEVWEKLTLVECELETGRTHQIRVHMNYLGHPLVGDTLYDEFALELEEGHLLHSYELSFTHPITKERHLFQTDLPKRFKALKKGQEC